ncbi:hypothetical protein CC78DRAFT_319541 [Lojkania enalia]|uniref:Uncharacterized protein n=1 Tax=Lojkania enalia TaxID=147567 RepID=A0A9P4N4S8_9PLEO|nr:hypothetical protein CC78DRAFT_319541 [Didymosphaeria enalia]
MPGALHSVAAAAKAHHDSVNAAYQTYYSSGSPSTRPSMESQQPRRESHDSTASTQSHLNKAWESIKKAAKQHHQSVNSAYGIYYGNGVTPSATPRPSAESVRHADEAAHPAEKTESGMKKMWEGVKKQAKAHHDSVNAAVGTYYGAGKL